MKEYEILLHLLNNKTFKRLIIYNVGKREKGPPKLQGEEWWGQFNVVF